MKKMTKKEMYEVIKAVVVGREVEVSEEDILAFCDKEIETLDKKATKAKERAAEKKAQADALTEAIYAVVGEEEFETIADITAKVPEEFEATVSKVTYRLARVLAEKGLVESGKVEIPASETSKKRTVTGYRRVTTPVEE